jgi:hypothetical protein
MTSKKLDAKKYNTIIIFGYYFIYQTALVFPEKINIFRPIGVAYVTLGFLFLTLNDPSKLIFDNTKHFFIMSAGMILSYMNGNMFYKEAGFFVIFTMLYILLSSNSLDFIISRNLFYFYAFFMLAYAILDHKVFDLYASQKSGTTIMMIALSSYYHISCIQNNKKIEFLPSLLTLILAVWSTSRAGILVSSFMCLFFFNTCYKKIYKSYLFWISFSCIAITVTIIIRLNWSTIYTNYFIWFNRHGLDLNLRNIVWESFIINIKDNVSGILFGLSREKYVPQFFSDNPHNSYIYLHSNFGLIGIIYIIYLIYMYIRRIKKMNVVYTALLLVVLARIFTDTYAFNGYLDPIIFYLLTQRGKSSNAEVKSKRHSFSSRALYAS